jgi:hypothetical protein
VLDGEWLEAPQRRLAAVVDHATVRARYEVGSSVVHVVSSVPVRAVPWAGERAMRAGRWASSDGLLLSGGMLGTSPPANATGEAETTRSGCGSGWALQGSQERQKAGATR